MVEEVNVGEPLETFETFRIFRKDFDPSPGTRKTLWIGVRF